MIIKLNKEIDNRKLQVCLHGAACRIVSDPDLFAGFGSAWIQHDKNQLLSAMAATNQKWVQK